MLVGTLLVATVAGAGAWVLCGSELLAVRKVEVTGQRLTSKERVLAAARVRRGERLIQLDTSGVVNRVEAVQEVETAWVDRRWPSTVRIVVRERTPVAVGSRDGQHLLIDRYGVTVMTARERPRGLPDLVVAHPAPADPATHAALAVWRDLRPDLRGRLQAIEAPTAEAVTLRLTKRLTIVWGAHERTAEKHRVLDGLLRRGITSIDVSSPEVVTAR